MSASFKGFYKAAKFYSQKPQVYSSVSEADKNVVFPLFLYTFPGAVMLPPSSHTNHRISESWHIVSW